MEKGKIVVFDSGLGGISVLRELVKLLPQENFIYFGDSAMAPYGGRTTQQVCELTLKQIAKLMSTDTKAVVVACNTATSAAIDILRQRYPRCIIIGIEPALKVAADHFPGGRILVMATEVTLREEKFARLMQRFERTHQIEKVACPGLVELIENGMLEGEELNALLHSRLDPFLKQPADAVVLGCTHYPFVRRAISKIVGPETYIIDGGVGTAEQTRRRLERAGMLNTEGTGSVEFQNSLDSERILALSKLLLEKEL